MKPILMKANLCFSFFIFFISSLSATPVFWNGNGDGVFWNDPDNWSTGEVPGYGSDVELPQNFGQIYYNEENTIIASLDILSGTDLRILEGNTLHLYKLLPDNSTNYSIENHGHFQNDGHVIIYNETGGGIQNHENFQNFGILDVTNFLHHSLWNSGLFENLNGGTMELSSSDRNSIYSQQTFYNNGDIFLYESDSGLGGINVNSDFLNDINGTISIGSIEGGITIIGNFRNKGHIEFSEWNYATSSIVLSSNGNFINESSGHLIIDGYQNNQSIFLGDGCFFTNAGHVELNNEESSWAVYINGLATFTNLENATLEMKSEMTVVLNYGDFKNSGMVTISNAQTGILNYSSFINHQGGIIEISDSSFNGITNVGDFLNVDATLSFSSIEDRDIFNWGHFENISCGVIVLDRQLNNFDGTFINYGWLNSLSEGPDHEYGTSKILNYGIVVDPHNRFVDALDNFQTRIVGLENVAAGTPITDAFDVFDTSKAIIESPFFTFPEMKYAGYYNHKDNIYFPNENVSTSNVLIFNTTIGDCSKEIQIPIEHASFKYVEVNQPNHEAEEVSLNIFPNPTTDGIQVNLTDELKGDGQLELMNAQGKIVHTKMMNDHTTMYIDLLDYPAGTYFLRVFDNGELLFNEKVSLMN